VWGFQAFLVAIWNWCLTACSTDPCICYSVLMSTMESWVISLSESVIVVLCNL
jgi:hypothetical protein